MSDEKVFFVPGVCLECEWSVRFPQGKSPDTCPRCGKGEMVEKDVGLVPKSDLRELIEEWRAKQNAEDGLLRHPDKREGIKECADELEELLEGDNQTEDFTPPERIPEDVATKASELLAWARENGYKTPNEVDVSNGRICTKSGEWVDADTRDS